MISSMNIARIIVAVIGIAFPYLARFPRGMEWVAQYTNTGLVGFLLLGAFNALAWGSIIGVSFLYRRVIAMLFPALFGFGFLGWAHYSLDLRTDAQAAISLVFIPILSLAAILAGGVLGLVFDRYLGRQAAA